MDLAGYEFWYFFQNLWGRDIALEENDVSFAQRLDGLEIDANNFSARADKLCGNLKPATWSRPQVDDYITGSDETEALL
jgi:hypothetical protein